MRKHKPTKTELSRMERELRLHRPELFPPTDYAQQWRQQAMAMGFTESSIQYALGEK